MSSDQKKGRRAARVEMRNGLANKIRTTATRQSGRTDYRPDWRYRVGSSSLAERAPARPSLSAGDFASHQTGSLIETVLEPGRVAAWRATRPEYQMAKWWQVEP